MSDKKVEISGGGGWIALALLIIFFWGDPDIADAIIAGLMKP
jgi:ABC-type uncharacterized transport system permease subunit